MGFPLLDILNIGSKVIDRVLPDKAAQDAAKLELLKLQQAGELAAMDADVKAQLAQIDVNKTEAGSGDKFSARWRPLCGYVGAFGLAYQFLAQPLLAWVSGMHWLAIPPPPSLDLGDLLTILGGMLGLGALRTKEKLSDKA